jgi:uncharacterized protein (TIGR02996 family)
MRAMTDEEPFIRAILDSPGDETPRLVYADWLEERGDPRGVYLRAEQEAVKTGDTSKMQELAVGLDSVWVARVTLPPLGVCCEDVLIRERGPMIGAQDIERFEQTFDLTLPYDYRAFLLNYNGGVVGKYFYEAPDGERFYPSEHKFYSLRCRSREGKTSKLEWWTASRFRYLARDFAEYGPDPQVEAWFLQFIPVCGFSDGISVLLGATGAALGQVYLFDWGAGFFPGFFNVLGDPDAASFAEYLSICLSSPARAIGFRTGEGEDDIPF